MAAMDHEQVSLDHVAVVVTLKSASRRDQEEGGELDSHDDVRHFCGSRRDQEESGPLKLDPQVSPEEMENREVELGSESWTSSVSVVTQQQCYGHCPCGSAPQSS